MWFFCLFFVTLEVLHENRRAQNWMDANWKERKTIFFRAFTWHHSTWPGNKKITWMRSKLREVLRLRLNYDDHKLISFQTQITITLSWLFVTHKPISPGWNGCEWLRIEWLRMSINAHSLEWLRTVEFNRRFRWIIKLGNKKCQSRWKLFFRQIDEFVWLSFGFRSQNKKKISTQNRFLSFFISFRWTTTIQIKSLIGNSMQNSFELDANCTKEFLTKFSDDNVLNCFYLITSVRLLLPVKCTHRKHDKNWWWCLKISMLMHCWQIKWQSESIVVTVNKQFCKMLLNGNSDVQCRCSIFFSGCQWCVYMHCIANTMDVMYICRIFIHCCLEHFAYKTTCILCALAVPLTISDAHDTTFGEYELHL